MQGLGQKVAEHLFRKKEIMESSRTNPSRAAPHVAPVPAIASPPHTKSLPPPNAHLSQPLAVAAGPSAIPGKSGSRSNSVTVQRASSAPGAAHPGGTLPPKPSTPSRTSTHIPSATTAPPGEIHQTAATTAGGSKPAATTTTVNQTIYSLN